MHCGTSLLDLSSPQVMGILNVTPDSFSDGGRFVDHSQALRQAQQMIDEGATIIDIGGESTRPGATPVAEDEEIQRVIPIIKALRAVSDVIISIDTSKPAVMRAAVDAGANFINDVQALREAGAIETAAELAVPVCLMHAQGKPTVMQDNPKYQHVVHEVRDFLQERIELCVKKGIGTDQLCIDPGFGFGKRVRHNLRLLKSLSTLVELGLPVLVGVSRKSIVGKLLDIPVEERLAGSLALTAISVWQGAKIIRTHDVQATVHAVKMSHYVQQVEDSD